jgi:release factor glutamine methyltransferase
VAENSEIKKQIWTVGELIKWGTDYFNEKGIASPRLNIELLLCHILSSDRIGVYMNHDKPLNSNELQSLKNLVKRRISHEPVQYITGKAFFLGNEFLVNNSVLIPRPETEILTDFFIKNFKNNNEKLKILEIGTGSGCIAVTLAKQFPHFEIHALDISEKVLEIARINAERHNIANIQFYNHNILEKPLNEIYFDAVISNPPYINSNEYKKLEPEVINYEPKESLTDNCDGLTFYKHFAKIFSKILVNNGTFFLEIGWGQYDEIKKIFSLKGIKINCLKDFNNIERVIYGSV